MCNYCDENSYECEVFRGDNGYYLDVETSEWDDYYDEIVRIRLDINFCPFTKLFGYITNADNISLDSFCELVRISDEFCHSIVMSVFANSIRDVENDVNNYFKTIS